MNNIIRKYFVFIILENINLNFAMGNTIFIVLFKAHFEIIKFKYNTNLPKVKTYEIYI